MQHSRPRWSSLSVGLGGAPLIVSIALVLVLARMLDSGGRSGGSPTGYVVTVACALALAGRRRWPVAVLAVTLALAVLTIALGGPTGAIALPALVALYGLAADGRRRQALLAALLTAVVLALARGLFQARGWSDARTAAEPVLVFAALFLGWAVSDHRAYVAEVEDRAARAERSREEEARRRVDAERLRIARELHDVLAHSIATISVQAGVAGHVIDEHPERAKEALAAIRAITKDALRELRDILGILRSADASPPRAPVPGLDQLDALLAGSAEAGISARLVVTGRRPPLPATVEQAAYRIVQESLTNVLRHGAPTSAAVAITYRPDTVVIEVDDDGRPEDRRAAAARASATQGHGIPGMRERARALGGELDAGPRPHGGFRVRASLPVAPRS